MRAGIVILPEHRWWAAEPLWRMAEEYGFHHAWTYDHLGWRDLVDKPWFDAVTTLTAAATVTSRIKLGTFVASPNFRHPVSLTRSITGLDDVSDGRFLLGAGAGGTGFDDQVLGGGELTPHQRVDRFGEFLELLDEILTHDSTTWRGEYFEAVGARRAPGCVQSPRVPFVVAANGTRSMRLAAEYGEGWVTTGLEHDDDASWWHSVGELSKRMDDVLEETGRASNDIQRYLNVDAGPRYSLTSAERFLDVLGKATERGFTDVVTHWPRPDGPYAGQESVLEEIADEVLLKLEGNRGDPASTDPDDPASDDSADPSEDTGHSDDTGQSDDRND